MYWPKTVKKTDSEARWSQTDRVFFGFGACHILAGVFLQDAPVEGFFAEWIVPAEGFRGTHMFVSNGTFAFDFHGYSNRARLLDRYWQGYQERYPGWEASVVRVDFPLLETSALNARGHRGPDQYFGDPVERARRFIARQRVMGQPHIRFWKN